MLTIKHWVGALRSPMIALVAGALLLPFTAQAEDEGVNGVINLLFIGHEHRKEEGGFHLSHVNAPLLNQALVDEKIYMTYREDLDLMTKEGLAQYDAVLLYANYETLSDEREAALVSYVEEGGAFLPIHTASACFGHSENFIDLVGGRFKSHGAGEFTATIAPDQKHHPVMKGFGTFETWDETYVHSDHNEEGRTVLMHREEEPWTWVREQGEGRVFYTAYGHDHRTWSQPAFKDLVIRGLLWSVGEEKRKANRALVDISITN